MLQGEHSAILSNFIKQPFGIKTFVLPILFQWSFYTGFTVDISSTQKKQTTFSGQKNHGGIRVNFNFGTFSPILDKKKV